MAIPHGFQNLGVKLFGLPLEKIMTAGIESARLDSAHERGHEILYRARDREILFILFNAHQDSGSQRRGSDLAKRICDLLFYVNGEEMQGTPPGGIQREGSAVVQGFP
jgi:hypothetical protein